MDLWVDIIDCMETACSQTKEKLFHLKLNMFSLIGTSVCNNNSKCHLRVVVIAPRAHSTLPAVLIIFDSNVY